MLAGHDLPADWRWRDIRSDPHPKESYFARFLAEHRKVANDAAGRAIVAEEAGRAVRRICDRCPEDFGRLVDRIRQLL